MTDAKRAGRAIGVLMFAQMAGAGLVNGVLLRPVTGEPGFLVNGALHARQVGVAALLLILTESMLLAIGVTLLPVVWERGRVMAAALVALGAVTLALGALEAAQTMTMVSASKAWAAAGGAQREYIEALRPVIASARNWAHFLGRIADGVTGFVFAATLFRFRLVPRIISGLAMLAAPVMLASLARPFVGGEVIFLMLAPIGLVQLVLASWLVLKGLSVSEGRSS